MLYFKPHNLTIVPLAGIIITVITLLTGASVFGVMERQLVELLNKRLQLALNGHVVRAESEIEIASARTMLIATRPLLINLLHRADADDTEAQSKLNISTQSLVERGINGIALYGEDGQELARFGRFAQLPRLTVSLYNLPGSAQLIWDGQLLLRTVLEMKKDGRVVGTVMTETKLPMIMDLINDAADLGETGDLSLCARYDLSIQCFPTTLSPKPLITPPRTRDGTLLPMAHAFEGRTGFVITKDYRDQMVTAAYAPVGDLGLGMVLKIDSAEFHAPIWGQLRYLIPLLAGMLILALLLLRWRLTPMVRQLTNEVAERKHAQASLRDSEAILSATIDTALDAIVQIDNKGLIIKWSNNAEKMFGWLTAEIMGRYMSETIVPLQYREAHHRGLKHFLATGEGPILNKRMEITGLHRNGHEFPIELSIATFKIAGEYKFSAFIRDISERKQVERAKSEFLSTVSHELRTPLTSIKGSLSLIKSGNVSGNTTHLDQLVDIGLKNSLRLESLVNDLLDMDKMEAGMTLSVMGEVDISHVIEETITEMSFYNVEHGIRFQSSGNENPMWVIGDEGRLKQVLTNLLSNASKFSKKSAEVEIQLSSNDSRVFVSVKDYGAGIPEEARANIFERFTQADSSDQRRYGGTGLGLNIAKSIIEEHGGSIEFQSEVGAGTTFRFSLKVMVS